MTTSRMTRLMESFDRAINLPPDEQAPFVHQASDGDEAFRRDLESLLEEHETAEEYFDRFTEFVVAPAYETITRGPDRSQFEEALKGSYRILEELGGGMSRVFLAEEVRLGRKVVIKVLPPGTAARTRQDQFGREIQLAAQLQHPHIVPLLTSESVQGLVYYTMPYVTGETLRARLDRTGALPVGEAVEIWRDVLEALAHAHTSGVVHRDIKPANILLGAGHAMVSDFGIARAIEAAGAPSEDHEGLMIVGTLAYMAPEQLRDNRTGPRSDLYATGLVMYEMLSGRLPFAGRSTQEVTLARLTSEPLPLAREDCPPALRDLVMACLASSPDDRPASAEQVLTRLDAVSALQLVAGTRRRWSRVAIALALTSVAAIGVALKFGNPPPPALAVPRRSSTNLEAHEWFRRGSDVILQRGRTEDILDYMTRAVAADSNFAEAWAGLAGALLNVAGREAGEELALFARADSAALRAISLDDSLAAGHAALGWTRISGLDWPAAYRSLTRAIELDPRTPRAYEGLARYHLWVGTPAQQLDAALKGVDVDPFSHSAVRELAMALAMQGRCDEANAKLLPLKDLTPPSTVAGVIRGQCFAAQGRWHEAEEEFRWSMNVGRPRIGLALLGYVLAQVGQRDSAQTILDDLLAGREYSHGSFGIATVYLGLGDLERAIEWMEKSAVDGTVRMYLMGPMYDDLRRDPRFSRVRQRMRLGS